MIKIKFLLIIFILSIFWNCSNFNLDLEQEDISSEFLDYSDPQLSLPYRLLVYDSDKYLIKFMKIIYDENFLGRNLIKALDHSSGWINMIFEPEIRTGTMLYAGGGYIYFNMQGQRDDDIEQLLFHELFHAYQHPEMSFEKNINDEIEAYLAQYLYCMNKGFIFSAVSDKFTELIKKVGKYFNRGSINESEKFSAAYKEAVDYLLGHPAYMGDWKTDVHIRELNNLYEIL